MWIYIAILGYTLLAVEAVIGKYIIAGRMKNWQTYAFYVGLFSSFCLILAPFGLKWSGFFPFLASFVSGILFYLGLIFLYRSLLRSSASRVYILFGATSTIATTLLAQALLDDVFSMNELIGILFLVLGGIFISYKFYASRLFSNYHWTILSGLVIALSLVLLKYGYNEQKFVSGYILSRLGIFSGAVFSFAIPSFRKTIIRSLKRTKRKENIKNFLGTVGAKSIAGAGTLVINYGIAVGSVAIVSSLVSVQYLLTFVFALALSFYFKKVFVERLSPLNFFTKMLGIIFVTLGTILVIYK